MRGYQSALSLLPVHIRAGAEGLKGKERETAMEFRLRRGYVPTVLLPDGEKGIHEHPVKPSDLMYLQEAACRASPYTVKESLAQGYIIAPNGVRIGLCGQMNRLETGEYCLAELTSVSVRIPRQVMGCAEGLMDKPFVSTLILSPPGWGKTTLLRDMIRILSDRGMRIGLCDERGEVAACSHGENGFCVGRCTDVMTGLPKAKGAMALLRSMNPQILVMDEITAPEDVVACAAASNCGVSLLATAHAFSVEDLHRRGIYKELLERKEFQRLIVIEYSGGERQYREVKL